MALDEKDIITKGWADKYKLNKDVLADYDNRVNVSTSTIVADDLLTVTNTLASLIGEIADAVPIYISGQDGIHIEDDEGIVVISGRDKIDKSSIAIELSETPSDQKVASELLLRKTLDSLTKIEMQTELKNPITANVAVGGVSIGDIFEEGTQLEEVLRNILIKYYEPSVKISVSPAFMRKGTTDNLINISSSVTVNSYPITSWQVEKIVGGIASTLKLESSEITSNFEDTMSNVTNSDVTYKTSVYDGKKWVSDSGSSKYILPYYYGTTSDPTNYRELTESLQGSGNKTLSFSMSNEYVIFMYDKSYGKLKSILDQNGFENLSDFTLEEVTVDFGYGDEIYNKYTSNSKKTSTGFKYTFKL